MQNSLERANRTLHKMQSKCPLDLRQNIGGVLRRQFWRAPREAPGRKVRASFLSPFLCDEAKKWHQSKPRAREAGRASGYALSKKFGPLPTPHRHFCKFRQQKLQNRKQTPRKKSAFPPKNMPLPVDKPLVLCYNEEYLALQYIRCMFFGPSKPRFSRSVLLSRTINRPGARIKTPTRRFFHEQQKLQD